MNHSETLYSVNNDSIVTIALCDIQAGEEIICNYFKMRCCDNNDHRFHRLILEMEHLAHSIE